MELSFPFIGKECHDKSPYSGFLLLIGLYYFIGGIIYCYTFHWSLLDSLCVVTMNLSIFGRCSFIMSHDNRFVSLMLSIVGRVLSLYFIGMIVVSETSSTRTTRQLLKGSGSFLITDMEEVIQRRLYVPLVQAFAVIMIGAYFFAQNEYWSISESLCYAVLQHITVGLQGWPDNSLSVRSGSSKLFLLGYVWVYSGSVLYLVGNLCAYRLEYANISNEKCRSLEQFDFRTISGGKKSSIVPKKETSTSVHEQLLNLLVQLDIFNKDNNIDVDESIEKLGEEKNEWNQDNLRAMPESQQCDQIVTEGMLVEACQEHVPLLIQGCKNYSTVPDTSFNLPL